MLGFYDAYTAAQIELMAIDCPVTVYGNPSKKGSKPKANDIRKQADKWEKKYKDKAEVELDLSGFKLNTK